MEAISTALSAAGGAQSGEAVAISVLKKAIDIEAQNAVQLLQALPQPTAQSNPAHLGQGVDTFA